ncbi:hypothetical protein GCM10022226_60840 [Sphaerisporangium flaviroseum]|uniref:Metalloprotease n=1 Tax=Sphaerisporangium flaviroseum TaxID=509199 RepID=A0ABP7J1G6_9ACTN
MSAVALLPIGSASATVAYPVKSKTLTDNPLYAAGALTTTTCSEKPIKKLSASSAKSSLNGVLACLNRTWAAQLDSSGQRFSKPKIVYTTKTPKRFCGEAWPKGSTTIYCDSSRTIHMVLTRTLLKEPGDLYLLNLLAVYYGEHVQNLTGIYRAFQDVPYRNKSELTEQNRRYNLQGDCFAGAFIGSVWDSLDRPRVDWDDLLYYLRDWSDKYNGTRKSITYWAGRGFKSADPASCDTWSAASSKVA